MQKPAFCLCTGIGGCKRCKPGPACELGGTPQGRPQRRGTGDSACGVPRSAADAHKMSELMDPYMRVLDLDGSLSAVVDLKAPWPLSALHLQLLSHRPGPQAMDAGREIFATALLPDRKLRWLAQQPLALLPPGRDGERRLMLWVFEDALKQRWAAGS